MTCKPVRIAIEHFWEGFTLGAFLQYFPFLRLKYRFIEDPAHPDIVLRSSFVPGERQRRTIRHMSELPAKAAAPTLFFTGENVRPDFSHCDWAISFCRDIDDPRHLRVPLWVPRLYAIGWRPDDLLSTNLRRPPDNRAFCNFIFSNPVPERERLFRLISTRKRVDAPGISMHNHPSIGGSFWDKYRFMSNYRFSIASENERCVGYSTEKIMEAFLAGTIPVYAGDPSVTVEFNPEAFLEVDRCGGLCGLADQVLAVDGDRRRRGMMAAAPVYNDDRLPECAREDRMMAFFEQVLG